MNIPKNKLHKILPKLTDRLPSHYLTGREESALALSRLHIGQSHATYLFFLKGEGPPCCVSCDELLSLEHILLLCSDLIDIRHKYFNVDSLKVFEEISSLRMSSSTFLNRLILSISYKFLIRNIRLVLILNCLNVWMSEWFIRRWFHLNGADSEFDFYSWRFNPVSADIDFDLYFQFLDNVWVALIWPPRLTGRTRPSLSICI